MKRFAFFILGILAGLLVLASTPLFAADAVTQAATIDAGWFVQFLVSYVMPTLGLIIALGLGKVYVVLKAKWGLDIDAQQRDALQTAITNAAGLLIAKGAHIADGKTIDVGNPMIAQAVRYVQDAAPGALAHFGLDPAGLAQKIVAKIGAIGAAAPLSVAPAAAADPAPVAPAAAVPAAG